MRRTIAITGALWLGAFAIACTSDSGGGGTKTDSGVVADTGGGDGPVADTGAADTGVDAPRPDTLAPDTLAPDTLAPDTLAPDTLAPDTLAPDTLAPDTAPPVGNDKCAGATPLALKGGRVTVSGTTAGVKDEFPTVGCGYGFKFVGPQRYYSFTATAGKAYRISLKVIDAAWMYLYVFSKSAGCTAKGIEASCGSGGKTGDKSSSISRGRTGGFVFRPATSGTYIVAADSTSATRSGRFEITIEEVTAPANDTCAKATAVTIPAGGKATVKADTSLATAEFSPLTCRGASTRILSAPEVYYKFTARAGKAYTLTVTPNASWCPYVVAFSKAAACKASGISTDCSSKGTKGDVFGCSYAKRTYLFTPSAAGEYYLAVRGSSPTSSSSRGPFTLEIAETTLPKNGACTSPTPITITAGKVTTVTGDTSLTKPELTSLRCGGTSTLRGPQLYYEFDAKAGTSYRFTLTPTFYTHLVVFPKPSSCSFFTVERACSAAGGGAVFGGSSTKRSYVFTATKSGKHVVAVKSISTSYAGKFTLAADIVTLPKNVRCSGATFLDLSKGKQTASGDLSLSAPDFPSLRCRFYTLRGPQHYYRFKATAGKTYKVKIKPSGFCAYIGIAPASCTASSLAAGCSSSGKTGDIFGCSSLERSYVFSPSASGDYVLFVKTSSTSGAGSYSLELEEVVPPKNRTCSAAAKVTLDATGKGTINGDLLLVARPDMSLRCGFRTFAGSRLYYELPPLKAGEGYTLTLSPKSWSAYMILFPKSAGCDATKAGAGCGSGGASGAYYGSVYSGSRTYAFAPKTPGSYILAVGTSSTTSTRGEFSVTVNRVSTKPPANQSCSTAAPLTLIGGKATVKGSTVFASAEFGSSVNCAKGSSFRNRMYGKDVYYKLNLTKGKAYRFDLTAAFRASMYIFGDTCTATAIKTACSSAGVSGARAIGGTAGTPVSLLFVAPATGTYRLAVDSTSSSEAGPFTLSVAEVALPTLKAPVTLNFDTTCGGLAATGDWECSQAYAWKRDKNCDTTTGAVAPTKPYSGKGMWGTKLNGCFSPKGNNALAGTCNVEDPSDDSILVFNVTIPAAWKTASMTFRSWDNYNGSPSDWGDVRIDGTKVGYTLCGSTVPSTPSWQLRTVDLSSYVGKTIRVSFHFRASTVVQYAGWYVDDVSITGK